MGCLISIRHFFAEVKGLALESPSNGFPLLFSLLWFLRGINKISCSLTSCWVWPMGEGEEKRTWSVYVLPYLPSCGAVGCPWFCFSTEWHSSCVWLGRGDFLDVLMVTFIQLPLQREGYRLLVIAVDLHQFFLHFCILFFSETPFNAVLAHALFPHWSIAELELELCTAACHASLLLIATPTVKNLNLNLLE